MKVAEIKVSYQSASAEKVKIRSSSDAYDCIMSDWNLETIELLEEVKIILLNRANDILGYYNLSKGGTFYALVDIKLLLSIALKCNAHGIIVVHNHPSGNLNPSETDIALTAKIKEACKLVDLTLLDHLVVCQTGYFSFADEGIL